MTLPQDVEKHSSVEKAAVEALLQTVHKFLPPESEPVPTQRASKGGRRQSGAHWRDGPV